MLARSAELAFSHFLIEGSEKEVLKYGPIITAAPVHIGMSGIDLPSLGFEIQQQAFLQIAFIKKLFGD